MGLFAPNYGPPPRREKRPSFGDAFGEAMAREIANYPERERRDRIDSQRLAESENAQTMDAYRAGFRPAEAVASAMPVTSPIVKSHLPEALRAPLPSEGLRPFRVGPGGTPTRSGPLPYFDVPNPDFDPASNALQAALNEGDVANNMEAANRLPGVTVGGRNFVHAPGMVAAEKMEGDEMEIARALRGMAELEANGQLTPEEATAAKLDLYGVSPGIVTRQSQEDRMAFEEFKSGLRANEIGLRGEEARRTRQTPTAAGRGRTAQAKPPKDERAEFMRKQYQRYVAMVDSYKSPMYTAEEAQAKAMEDAERMFGPEGGRASDPTIDRGGSNRRRAPGFLSGSSVR